ISSIAATECSKGAPRHAWFLARSTIFTYAEYRCPPAIGGTVFLREFRPGMREPASRRRGTNPRRSPPIASRPRFRLCADLKRRRQPRFARRGPLRELAGDFGAQFAEIDEDVGLAAQFVGDHRRLARYGRNHSDANTATLYRFDQRT